MKRFRHLTAPGSFPPGTNILTNSGDVPVERLSPGDRVLTADGENVRVRRVACRTVGFSERRHGGKPILIRAGALGSGLPTRDLVVAPWQRLALADAVPAHVLMRAGYVVPAVGLTGLPGVRRMKGRRNLLLYSVVLETPAMLIAEGCVTESTPPLAARLANVLTRGWAGAIAGLLRPRGQLRAISIWQARRLASRLRLTGDLPRRAGDRREHDLLAWEEDLAIERRLAESAGVGKDAFLPMRRTGTRG
jgi:hypothetical protein